MLRSIPCKNVESKPGICICKRIGKTCARICVVDITYDSPQPATATKLSSDGSDDVRFTICIPSWPIGNEFLICINQKAKIKQIIK